MQQKPSIKNLWGMPPAIVLVVVLLFAGAGWLILSSLVSGNSTRTQPAGISAVDQARNARLCQQEAEKTYGTAPKYQDRALAEVVKVKDSYLVTSHIDMPTGRRLSLQCVVDGAGVVTAIETK